MGDRRVIDYPSQLSITLGTDSYWYNTISMGLGVEEKIDLNNDFIVIARLSVSNYLTFSQRYHIPYYNSFIPQPEFQIKNNYKKFKNENFGFGGELNIGVVKKIESLYIGPSIIIPLYDMWRQDSIFPTEINSESRNKWFRGIGTSIKILYTLK